MWYDYWVVLLPFLLIGFVWGADPVVRRVLKFLGQKEKTPKKGDLAPIGYDQWAAIALLQAIAIYSAGWKGLLIIPILLLVTLPFWAFERYVLKIPAKRVK